jgi:sugar phosphate isomerase/epimerase
LDRVLPGQGEIDLYSIFEALEDGGFRGWYDLEVFSGLDLPDSIWKRPTREWVKDGMDRMRTILSQVQGT